MQYFWYLVSETNLCVSFTFGLVGFHKKEIYHFLQEDNFVN